MSRSSAFMAYRVKASRDCVARQEMDRTSGIVSKQTLAMGCATFEVGLFMSDATGTATGPAMIPRTWDLDTLIRSIHWMRLQNLQGRNIYIRPHGEHNLTMLDDLKRESVDRMFASGFTPAVLVETSPGNFQAWLKHSRVLSRELSTAAARALADQFGGDKGAADWRHFGRLAGFTNRKSKYQSADGLFPFVRLHAATGASYPESDRFIDVVQSKLAGDRERAAQVRAKFADRVNIPHRNIEHFRSDAAYGGDGTRVDLAYAIYALSHGVQAEQVKAAIRSRDLSHKGNDKRQDEYIARTVNKARSILEERAFSQGR